MHRSRRAHCPQDLAQLATKLARAEGRATLRAKVQGPFEGESLATDRVFTHVVACAGGIGATAILPLVMRAALSRADASDKGARACCRLYCSCSGIKSSSRVQMFISGLVVPSAAICVLEVQRDKMSYVHLCSALGAPMCTVCLP